MRPTVSFAALSMMALCLTLPRTTLADARGVGLGVAAGANVYAAELPQDTGAIESETQSSVAWGFFVDIPLLETFYISPAAMLYELDLGADVDPVPITDVDLNFKFIVPVGRLHIGAGVLAGLTTGLGEYVGHYGVLGYAAFNLVANLDAFAMVQYKKIEHETDISNYHGYVGGMFRF